MHFAPNIFIKKGNWITLTLFTAHSDKEHETQEHWEKVETTVKDLCWNEDHPETWIYKI